MDAINQNIQSCEGAFRSKDMQRPTVKGLVWDGTGFHLTMWFDIDTW